MRSYDNILRILVIAIGISTLIAYIYSPERYFLPFLILLTMIVVYTGIEIGDDTQNLNKKENNS